MKTISLTVPMDYNALTRASDMLHGLAIDLKHDGAEPVVEAAPAPAPVVEAQPEAAPAPAPVVEAQPEAAPAEAQPEAAAVFAGPVQPVVEAESATTAPAYTNPAVLVPWDARIHSGTPTKLAKEPNNWKKKRGVEDSLVAQVEAELIQAMQASPAPAAQVEAPAAQVEAPAAQVEAPAPAPAGGITTFPALMGAITSNGIDLATVLAAVNKQGLQALPLLAARPDLIPAVALELGV